MKTCFPVAIRYSCDTHYWNTISVTSQCLFSSVMRLMDCSTLSGFPCLVPIVITRQMIPEPAGALEEPVCTFPMQLPSLVLLSPIPCPCPVLSFPHTGMTGSGADRQPYKVGLKDIHYSCQVSCSVSRCRNVVICDGETGIRGG